MKLLPFRRFLNEDFPKAPQYFYDFLADLNPFVDAINRLFQGNIDITNNLLAERQTVSVQHGVAVTIKLQKLDPNFQRPFLVRAGYANGQTVSSVAITGYNSDGTFTVVVSFVGAPTATIPVLLVFEP